MKVHHADDPPFRVEHRSGHDRRAFEVAECRRREIAVAHQPRRAGHDGVGPDCQVVGGALGESGEVAGGDHPDQPVRRDDRRNAAAVRQRHHHLLHCRLGRQQGRRGHHYIAHPEQQGTAQRATRVQLGKVVGAESLALEERHRQCITEGEGHRGAGGWCQVVWAGFFRHRAIEHCLRRAPHGRVAPAGDGDHRHLAPRQCRQQTEQFFRLATLAQQDRRGVGFDDAEVAVQRFDGMEVTRRRAGRGQRRGNLARNDPRLADAADHHALHGGQQFDGGLELSVEPVGGGKDRVALGAQRPLPGGQCRRHRAACIGAKTRATAASNSPRDLRSRSITSRTAPWPPLAAVT